MVDITLIIKRNVFRKEINFPSDFVFPLYDTDVCVCTKKLINDSVIVINI
jgi:hypothetical protein